MTRHDLTVDAVLIVGKVSDERPDLASYLVEQCPNLRGSVALARAVRFLGVDAEDALTLSERTEV